MVKSIAGNKPKPLVFKDTISSPYDNIDQLPVLDEKASNQFIQELALLYKEDLNIKLKKKSLSLSLNKELVDLQYKLNGLYIKNKKCTAILKKRKKQLNNEDNNNKQQNKDDNNHSSDSIIKEKETELNQLREEMKPIRERMTLLINEKKQKTIQLDKDLQSQRKSTSISPFLLKGVNEITKAMEKVPIIQQQDKELNNNNDIKLIVICLQLASQGGNIMIEHLPMMATMRSIPYIVLANQMGNSLRNALGIKSVMALAFTSSASQQQTPQLDKLVDLGIQSWKLAKKVEYPLIGLNSYTQQQQQNEIKDVEMKDSDHKDKKQQKVQLKPVKILKEGNKRKK